MTTAHIKYQLREWVANCLLNSRVAESLAEGWEERLFAKHLEFPERTPKRIITTEPLEFGRKPGWISLCESGGGCWIILWVPGMQHNPQVRAEAEEIQRCLDSVLHLGRTQIRVREPHRWLREQGWPLSGNGTGG